MRLDLSVGQGVAKAKTKVKFRKLRKDRQPMRIGENPRVEAVLWAEDGRI